MINRRTALKAAVAAPAILWWSALDAACSRPAWPGTGNLPSQATLPDPFLLDFPLNLNATQRVATKAQWTRRHTQIISAAQHYIWGHMPPPAPVAVVSRFTGTKINGGNPGSQPQPGPPYQTIAGIHSRTVNLVTGPNLSQPGGNLPFQINVYWPVTQGGAFPNGTSGSGPWPVLLASEKSYSPVADNSGSSSEDASIGAANVAALVQRGYCIAEYGQNDFSQDTSDYAGNPPLTKIFTQGFPPGVYPMYPNDFNAGVTGYDWGMWALTAGASAASSIIW
jgi:hypothetical protein